MLGIANQKIQEGDYERLFRILFTTTHIDYEQLNVDC
jgi:hypothetical protein